MPNRVIVTKEQLKKENHFELCIIDENKILIETNHIWWVDA